MAHIRPLEFKDKQNFRKLIEDFYINFNRKELLPPRLLPFERFKKHGLDTEVELFLSESHRITFVVEEEGQLIGYVYGYIKEFPEKVYDKEGYIEELFIQEKYRNHGIGEQLMEKLTHVFKTKGCSFIGLSAFVTNKHAIDVYHHFGFIDVAIEMVKKI